MNILVKVLHILILIVLEALYLKIRIKNIIKRKWKDNSMTNKNVNHHL